MLGKLQLSVEKKVSNLPKWLGSNWVVALMCVMVTFALLSSVLVLQTTTFFTNLDNVDQFYTWYQKLATSIHQGYLPVWNANVFGGQSFAGELQPGVFYPLNILWVAIFGSVAGIGQLALDYLVAVHFALGAFGCYLLLKELGMRKWSSFLAGITFAFSGALAFRSISQTAIFFGLALLPFALYFFVKAYNSSKSKIGWLILSGVFLGLIVLSGHIAPFFFSLLVIGIFAAVQIWRGHSSWLSIRTAILTTAKNLIIVVLSAVIIAAPQIIVSASYLNHSYRIQATGYAGPDEKIDYGHFAKSFSLDVHEFANLIDPVSYPIKDGNSIFIGLASFGIIILALIVAGRQLKLTGEWKKQRIFITTLLIVGAVAMLGYVTWLAVVLYELPFVYQVRQLGRYSILFHLALVALLAIALPIVASLRLTKRQKWTMLAIGGFLLVEAVYLLLLRDYIFSLHHALQVGVLALLLIKLPLLKSPELRKVLLVMTAIATAWINTLWFLPTIKADTKLPQSYSLPTSLVSVLENTKGKYRVEIQDDALPMNTGNVYNVQTTWGYAATVYAPYYEITHTKNIDPELVKDLMGVQLVAQKQTPYVGQEVIFSDPHSGAYIVKRPTALPKFFTSNQIASTSRDAYAPLLVSTEKYQDQYQKYLVTTDSNVEAIISEISYPGWVAKVDGVNTDLGTYTIGDVPLLKSVNIPAGTHTIELLYKPFQIF